MKKVVAFVAIIGLLLVGCGKPKVAKYCPQPGHGYACDASKHVTPMKDGKLHGVSKAYSYKGTLFESITYVEGKKEGLSTTYVGDNTYPGGANAGKPFRVTPYVNNKKHGMEKRYWSDTGTIAELTPYVNGKKHGTYKKYFRDGKPAMLVHWKNGLLHGSYTFWGERGGGSETKNYVNGYNKGDRIPSHSENARYRREMDNIATGGSEKPIKSSSTSVVPLKCGRSIYDKSAQDVLSVNERAAGARGQGEAEAQVYISKHGNSVRSKGEVLNFCRKRINDIRMECSSAKAFVAGCTSQFRY